MFTSNEINRMNLTSFTLGVIATAFLLGALALFLSDRFESKDYDCDDFQSRRQLDGFLGNTEEERSSRMKKYGLESPFDSDNIPCNRLP